MKPLSFSQLEESPHIKQGLEIQVFIDTWRRQMGGWTNSSLPLSLALGLVVAALMNQ